MDFYKFLLQEKRIRNSYNGNDLRSGISGLICIVVNLYRMNTYVKFYFVLLLSDFLF